MVTTPKKSSLLGGRASLGRRWSFSAELKLGIAEALQPARLLQKSTEQATNRSVAALSCDHSIRGLFIMLQ